MNETLSSFKKLLPLAIIIAMVVGGVMWFLKHDDGLVSTEQKEPSAPTKRPAPLPKFPTAKDVTDASLSKRAFFDYGSKDKTTKEDLKLVDDLIQNFYLIAKDQSNRFPMGTNREITRVLAGHNPMKRAWISAGHPAVDDRGELTDRWDTPLHFHALARGVFEIRSAGPDRAIFTEDDIVHGTSQIAEQISPPASDVAGTERPEEI